MTSRAVKCLRDRAEELRRIGDDMSKAEMGRISAELAIICEDLASQRELIELMLIQV